MRLRQDGDEDFPEKMCLDPKKYTPWMIVPKWCLVSRIFFLVFFSTKYFYVDISI